MSKSGVIKEHNIAEHDPWRAAKCCYSATGCDVRTVEASVVRGHDVVIDVAGLSSDDAADRDPALTEAINHGAAVRRAYAPGPTRFQAGEGAERKSDARGEVGTRFRGYAARSYV